jgi:hypothetical protein
LATDEGGQYHGLVTSLLKTEPPIPIEKWLNQYVIKVNNQE